MIDTMLRLKRYSHEVEDFLQCLELEALQGELSREEQTREHNAAIDGLQAIADRFNEQVRAFKARRG